MSDNDHEVKTLAGTPDDLVHDLADMNFFDAARAVEEADLDASRIYIVCYQVDGGSMERMWMCPASFASVDEATTYWSKLVTN